MVIHNRRSHGPRCTTEGFEVMVSGHVEQSGTRYQGALHLRSWREGHVCPAAGGVLAHTVRSPIGWHRVGSRVTAAVARACAVW